jgi:hypothetical protein
MNRRPLSITILSWVFITVGGIGLVGGLVPFGQALFSGRIGQMSRHELLLEIGLASAIRLLAVVAGVLMLYGLNWARWLSIAWVGLHIVLSIGHSPFELIVHIALFVIVAYLLLRPRAAAYFRSASVEPG